MTSGLSIMPLLLVSYRARSWCSGVVGTASMAMWMVAALVAGCGALSVAVMMKVLVVPPWEDVKVVAVWIWPVEEFMGKESAWEPRIR